ncbi:M1 family metallopeptidase [Chryseolinea sp. H1M3-3]|uniref:M1 family metallopeptidase n=1 Tax=Chryseolinea sp. H1M3-3 TaxID=3034144 RepID=UPI0023EB92D1|nr:M1 family metallopeptidase [Chryseolinea sp. H1M3-3]
MKSIPYFFTLFLLAVGCEPKTMKEQPNMIQDSHSFSKPSEARVTHLHWVATIDFSSKTITATATWQIAAAGDAKEIIFDTKDLSIEKVLLDNDQVATYKLTDAVPTFGQALAVGIERDTKTVSIFYKTSPDAEALQWLSPQQTAGKKNPFLFTQSQAILARSWVPCQDSPSVRFTYDSEVTVPSNLLALMSASNPKTINHTGVYQFRMTQPIPSYLLALAVGEINYQDISSRSGVYAEPSIVDTAAWEFADLEKMISGAEELYGKYRWDQYDVIVLPPSFPFGGMENPRITFATPTILAGDRSLTSLIAHELAHSWSGNLVTNATWEDFWLNEGFTVYFEHRIMEKLYGKDYSEMLALLARQSLDETIEDLKTHDNYADTKLKLNLKGRNPDEGVTDIAYNKGYFFLRSIEEKHGREKFDRFIKDYFNENAFKAMDTEGFTAYLKNYYQTKYSISIEDNFLKAWIYTEGLPADCPQPVSTRFEKVNAFLQQWKASGKLDPQQTSTWSTHEWLHFLKNLPDSLARSQMEILDNFGHFTSSGNAEILTVWLTNAIRYDYTPADATLEHFLIHTGRRKFLNPLYQELIKTPEGKKRAKGIYRKARPNYHFVATNTFDKLLN